MLDNLNKYRIIIKKIQLPVAAAIAAGYFLKLVIMLIQLSQPLILGWLIDKVILTGKMNLILVILGIALFSAILSSAISAYLSRFFGRIYMGLNYQLRSFLLKHLRKIPIYKIEKENPEKFGFILEMDCSNLIKFLTDIFPELLSRVLQLLISFGVLVFINFITGITGVVVAGFIFLIPLAFRGILKKAAAKIRSHIEKISSYLLECVEGSKEIRTLSLEKWEEARNNNLYAGLMKAHVSHSLYSTLIGEISTLAIMFVILLLYGFGAADIISGKLSVGLFVASVAYLHAGLSQVRFANEFYGKIKNLEVSIERIADFLSLPTEAYPVQRNYYTEETRQPDSGSTELINIRNLHVVIDHKEILKGINLAVKKNEQIALIGKSGSGKTTLYKAILGFVPVTEGSILFNNQPAGQLTGSGLYGKIGIVFQETFIFKTTLYNNILMGNPAAVYEEVAAAARNANLNDLIANLPEGLYSEVGNKGSTLSGGERQRIAIARMFLKQPDLLLLDEPMSSLDKENERRISGALDTLMKKNAIIISTHRIETIKEVHRIYILDEGRIVDQGTHEELIMRSGLYNILLHSREKQEAKYDV